MRRVAALAASVLVTVMLCPGRSVAATAPTISTPSVVRYWTAFTVAGTATPAASVNIYARREGQTSFHLSRTVTADNAGYYRTSVRIDATYAFYAVASGLKSTVVTSRIKTTTCTTSGPAFTNLPWPANSYLTKAENPNFPYFQAFASFTATRLGTWAGTAYNGEFQFAIITWRRGHPFQVLGRFDYQGGQGPGFNHRSVRVVGILPSGGVVTSVQRRDGKIYQRSGYVYLSGHRYQLLASPSWFTAEPTGVTSSGAIIGSVAWHDANGNHQYAIVRWASPTAAPHVLLRTGHDAPFPVVDRRGDIAYSTATATKVILASGQTRILAALPGGFNAVPLVGDGGSTIWGWSERGTGLNAVAAWSLATVPATGPIAPKQMTGISSNAWPWAVGAHGQVLNGYRIPTHMRTASGAYPKLPAILPADGDSDPGEAIDQYGTIAYTSNRDTYIHFFHCA